MKVICWIFPVFSLALYLIPVLPIAPVLSAEQPADRWWNVDDLRPGMKGKGRTCMKGTQVEPFDAVVLGVMKNTSPGRDLVLCRLSGLNLEHTGVIAGMSGSPIYIDGKLLGAVAYAWPFGKEPIAGVTPFSQMHGYVEAYERLDLAEQTGPRRVGLQTPVRIEGREYDRVTIAATPEVPAATADDGLWMVPLQTPVAATGFSPQALRFLRDRCKGLGLTPVQGGAASAAVAEGSKDVELEPGGPMAIALITGDFDLSGIGTVTHLEGDRVYGFGHPFMGLGRCEFPLMTGVIHTIYPRQSLSFKMGSPLRPVGIISADVSTCVAGWLDREADMIPCRIAVCRNPEGARKTFNVEIVRQRSLVSALVQTALTNSVDMEGDLPDELTADLTARIDLEGHAPLVIKDTFSGASYSGGRAPAALYHQIGLLTSQLTHNMHKPIRIKRIDCQTTIEPGRRSAEIESVALDSDTYAPGETVKASVFLRPYRGDRQRVTVQLPLPSDLPEGNYSATVCDDLSNARMELRDKPHLGNPQTLDQVFESLKIQTAAKRTNLTMRVPMAGVGVAVGGKALPDLPASMVQILGNSKRTGAQTLGGALVVRQATPWVVQGSDAVKFTVVRNKGLSPVRVPAGPAPVESGVESEGEQDSTR